MRLTMYNIYAHLLFIILISLQSPNVYSQHYINHTTATSSLNEIKPNNKLTDMNAQKNHDGTMQHKMPETMHSMYGNYAMTRDASGTSWVPDSSPEEGFHLMHKKWMLMFGGFSYLVLDHQTGPRGGKKIFDQNMVMVMAQRDFEKNTFALKSMFSLEPITIGKCGYPLLLQTGETCDGKTPLVDRQHSHDLFIELAVVNTYKFNDNSSAFLYCGLPGEPALGPPVFLMRFSSEYIPAPPLGHHWMDSTHITFGVLTAGFIYKNLKLEASLFTGREPDEHRFDIEKPRFDSHSFRISFNPTENIALQASHAFIKSPEKLHPEFNVRRTTLSAIYNKKFNDNNLQTTAILGINKANPGNTLPAFLLETTLELHKSHILFMRFETVKKDDLFIEPDPLAGKIFNVKKFTFGYIYEFGYTKHSKWGIGGLCDFPMVPSEIATHYNDAFGYMFFLQVKLI